jgi:uncharacterized membrane protein YccC
VSTAAGRRPLQAPGWLAEVARSGTGPVPWAGMCLTALGVGAPLGVGTAAGHPVQGVLVAVGGLVASLADRIGPYPARMRRVAAAGVFGGAGGLLVGTAINGQGWVAAAVLIVVAGVSALVSTVGAVWSTTGLYLLVYAILATGPLGAIQPWWLPPLWVLAGVAWVLLLMVPGGLAFPRMVEQRRVAAVYQALAADLRTLGTDGHRAARQGVTAALDVAYEEVRGQRAAAGGRDRRLNRLVALLNQARLAAEASAALASAGAPPPQAAAAQADALARAVLDGTAVAHSGLPPTTGPAMVALYGALDGAARVAAGNTPDADADVPQPARRNPLRVLAQQIRDGLVVRFAVRLMLCVGVAAVFSEVLPLQRSYWVGLAVAVVLKPDFGSVFARALQYAVGTVLGAVLSMLILAAQPPGWVSLAWVAIFALLLPYSMSRNYGLWTVFFTPLVVLLVDLVGQGGVALGEDRLLDVLLGCAIVLVLGYAPWPSSWHAGFPRDFADTAEQTARYLDQALGQRLPGTAIHAQARRQLAAMRVEFQRALAEPPRLRRAVTAWYPAMVALEWLLEAITAAAVTAAGEPLPVGAVTELSTAVRHTAAAARSGTPARREALPSPPPSLQLVRDAVRSLNDAVAEMPRPTRHTGIAPALRTGVSGGPA